MKTTIVLLALVLGCSSTEPPTGTSSGSGGSDAGTCSPAACPVGVNRCHVPTCDGDACVLVLAPDGSLCWGEADDKVHGQCEAGECVITEWGCTSNIDCDDAAECTSDVCKVSTGACVHEAYPRTTLCSTAGHCNPVDGSCCEVGFVEDRDMLGWFICVDPCPLRKLPRESDGLCVVP